uniref:Synaptobrevin-like protein n=1 Tax=Peronospora matthiolae TaxID=2874970 RepID=A0AAV1U7N5_9STRA
MLTRNNIKFLAIARATDKVIVACYLHSSDSISSRDRKADLTLFKEMLSKVIRAPMWTSQVVPDGRNSLECDSNKFHFTMTNDELVFAAITCKEYPVRLAFQVINAVQRVVVSTYGSKALTCAENELDGDCTQPFAAIATTYNDLIKQDKLSEVLSQVHDVQTIMCDSIHMALSNTEKLEVVEQKTNDLTEQAKVFCNSSRKLHHHVWWKHFKLVLVLLFIALLILLLILTTLGVFTNRSSAENTPALNATTFRPTHLDTYAHLQKKQQQQQQQQK